jgi:hypothetical protein
MTTDKPCEHPEIYARFYPDRDGRHWYCGSCGRAFVPSDVLEEMAKALQETLVRLVDATADVRRVSPEHAAELDAFLQKDPLLDSALRRIEEVLGNPAETRR